ncbi:MAG: ANTAR domain-containing protein [Kineosporiaceae bacterium]
MTSAAPAVTPGDLLPRRFVALAAAAVHTGLPHAVGIGIDVRRTAATGPSLSSGTDLALRIEAALAHGPARESPLDAVDRCRRDRRPQAITLGRPARNALAAADLGDVRWLAAAPAPEADAVVTAWLRRPARPPDLVALEESGPLVADAVRSAEDLHEHLVVPPTRLLIEQAKGVLMAHHGVGPDDAFDLLRAVSQRRNVPVRELARVVVDGLAPAGRGRHRPPVLDGPS